MEPKKTRQLIPTLLIGLGGTGYRTLKLIKKKFPLAMAQSDDPELFQKFKRRTLQYIVGKGHTLSLGVNRKAEYIKKAKN